MWARADPRPFGDGPVERLHAWRFDTPDENQAEIDRVTSAGAFVMGRNMFGPLREDWDLSWRRWWGETPPYHAPVSVLTHHPRDPLTMQGGTTFTFVTDGIHAALDQARAATGDRDVAIAGRAATVNQYLATGSIDKLRIRIAPVTLGAGHGRPLAVRELEEQGSGDLVMYGHGPLGQALLDNGLLDELRLWIYPLFVGHGNRLSKRKGRPTVPDDGQCANRGKEVVDGTRPNPEPGSRLHRRAWGSRTVAVGR